MSGDLSMPSADVVPGGSLGSVEGASPTSGWYGYVFSNEFTSTHLAMAK
jgi:hypothetical protein